MRRQSATLAMKQMKLAAHHRTGTQITASQTWRGTRAPNAQHRTCTAGAAALQCRIKCAASCLAAATTLYCVACERRRCLMLPYCVCAASCLGAAVLAEPPRGATQRAQHSVSTAAEGRGSASMPSGRGRGGGDHRGARGHGHGGATQRGRGGRSAGRLGGRGRGGREGSRGSGSSRGGWLPRQPAGDTLADWAAYVEQVCAHSSAPGGAYQVAGARLANVRRSDVRDAASQASALLQLERLLRCAAAQPRVLTSVVVAAAVASIGKHDGMLRHAVASRSFAAAARDVLEQAVGEAATWTDPRHASQLAVAQQRLSVFCAPFWEAMRSHGCAQLGGRQAANVLHAYAVLWQAELLPAVDVQLCKQLAHVVAAAREPLVPQNVSNTIWALGTLEAVPPMETLIGLNTVATRLSASMKPQEVSNSLLGLAKLGQPVDVSLQQNSLAALERCAAQSTGLNAQDVSNTLWALAELQWPSAAAVKAPAVAALHAAATRHAPDMKPQEVSNTLLGLAKLGHLVSVELQRALLAATHQCAVRADGMNEQAVANTLLALATLQWQVAVQVRVALLCAAGAQAPKVSAQGVANTLLAFATLQWPVEDPARLALSHAVGKLIPVLTAQNVANTLWAQAWFTVADGKPLRIDSAALFEQAASQRALKAEHKRQVRSAEFGKQSCFARLKLCLSEHNVHAFGCRPSCLRSQDS